MLKVVSKESVPLSVELSAGKSVHLLPGVPRDVEEAELAIIKQAYPDMNIRVMAEPVAKPKPQPARRKTTPVSEPEPEPEFEPDESNSTYSAVAKELIKKSVTAITNDLEEKEQLMPADEYRELLQELLDLENKAEVNRESPRVTLVRHLEAQLGE